MVALLIRAVPVGANLPQREKGKASEQAAAIVGVGARVCARLEDIKRESRQ